MEHPKYVSRSTWEARAPTGVTAIEGPTLTYVHHSGGNERGSAGMRGMQNHHMNTRKFRDIAYSWVIDGDDGVIYQGRGWLVKHGANLGDDNGKSHSICFMGNFEIEHPKQVALNSFVRLVQYGKSQNYLTSVLAGHRDELDANTDCPGRNLYAELPELRTLVNRPFVVPSPAAPTIGDDMFPYMVRNKVNGAVLLVLGESTTILVTSTDDFTAHQGAGFKTLQVSGNQFKIYELFRKTQ